MKYTSTHYSVIKIFAVFSILLFTSCERDLEDLERATYPTYSEVFIDGFSTGLEYEAWGDVTAFDVDYDTKYMGTASMKFAVPNEGDIGGYAGGRFVTTMPRNLSGYNALTFWAKATKVASINEIGFGNNNDGSLFLTSLYGIDVNTNWKKIIIPIANPDLITAEAGLLYYAESPEDGEGYTFWIDEVQFENLGTIAHPKPKIFGGLDKVQTSVIGVDVSIEDFSISYNMPNGLDQTMTIAPSYFNFHSSNESVATVDSIGQITLHTVGEAVITASINDVTAEGSLTITSTGEFDHAPDPSHAAEDVISIFSDEYTNVPVDFYNGYWEPYQTTLSADFEVDGDNILNYYNFNFVGIQFTNPTIDASNMTHLHMDIYIPSDVNSGDQFDIKLVDMGADGSTDDPNPSINYTVGTPTLQSQEWISIDVPLSALTSRSQFFQIIMENLGTSLSAFYLDNVYLYDDGSGESPDVPTEAAPTPTVAEANVISIYSDAYTDLAGTDYPDWGQTTVLSPIQIEGNNTLLLSGLDYQGIELASSLDASEMTHFHIDFWSANSTSLNIYLISTGPEETVYTLTVPTDGWSSVDIPLSAFAGVDLADVIQIKIDGNGDVYIDNLYFFDDNGGGPVTEPTQPAPTPTESEADVISLFSDAYTNISVDTWRTDWSSAVYEEVMIDGNAAKKYSELDFVGIETTSNTVDASEMTHIHIDVWSADFTQFSIKLVDFGADGSYDGGDDTEHQIDYASPNQGQWISYDIPLSEFTNMTAREHIAQYILVGQPTGATTIFIDNVYFHK